MGPVSAEVVVDVPRERAYELVLDLGRRPSFTDHFVSDFRLERVDSAGVGAGARFRLFSAPFALWMGTAIVEAQAPRLIREEGAGGRLNRIASHTAWEFLEGPGSMTTVRVTYWTSPRHPLDALKEKLGGAAFWYGRNWRTALRRLRDLLESGGPAPPPLRVAAGNRHPTGVP